MVLPANSLDLQTALDAVSEWGHKWRFTFGISPTKSAVMIFGPHSRVPSCAVTLAGSLLPIVNEYTNLGVVLTPSLTWLPHVRHLISRGNRLCPMCRLVLLGSSLSAFRSLPLSVSRASQLLIGIGVLPQLEPRCLVDRQCSAQVGSSSSRLAFKLPRRPTPLHRTIAVSLWSCFRHAQW